MTDLEIMQNLIKYSYEKIEKNNAYPFCSYIVREGVIISKGYNFKVQLSGDKTSHGEIEALKKACSALKLTNPYELGPKYEIFTTCEPCLACLDSIVRSGIRKIVMCIDHTDFPEYFNDHAYNIKNFENDNPGKATIITHLLQEEGLKLFKVAKGKYGW